MGVQNCENAVSAQRKIAVAEESCKNVVIGWLDIPPPYVRLKEICPLAFKHIFFLSASAKIILPPFGTYSQQLGLGKHTRHLIFFCLVAWQDRPMKVVTRYRGVQHMMYNKGAERPLFKMKTTTVSYM